MNRSFELKAALLFLVLLLFLLGTYSERKIRENESLKQGLRLLEADLKKVRRQHLLRIDSLQEHVEVQQQRNRQLKDSLHLLQHKRKHLTQRSDENKAAILRLRDVDSLRDLVAGHYR